MTPKFAQYSYHDDYVSVLFTPKETHTNANTYTNATKHKQNRLK